MTSSSSFDAQAFLSFTQNVVKFPDTQSLTTSSIKLCFDDPKLATLVNQIVASISDENVLSSQEISQFEEMQANSKCISKGNVETKVALLSRNVEQSKAELRELKEKVKQARLKKRNIEKDIEQIKHENSLCLNSLSDAKTIKLHTKSKLAECRESCSLSKKSVNENFIKLSKVFSELSELIKSETNGLYLSKVSLSDLMDAEDKYNVKMTEYVKKQFENASEAITTNKMENSSNDVNDDINESISRLIFSYPNLEKFYLSCKAKADSAKSTLEALKLLLSDLQKCQHLERTRKLIEVLSSCESQVDKLQSETDDISHTLTQLIEENAPLQSTSILSGNSQLKLGWQKYYTEKQKYVISLLQAQRSRLDLIWMLLDIEEASHKKTESHLPPLFKQLKEMLNESQSVCENLRKLDVTKESPNTSGIIKPSDKIANSAFKLLASNEEESAENVIKLISDLTKLSDDLMSVAKEMKTESHRFGIIQKLSSTIDTSKELIKLNVTDDKPVNETVQLFDSEVQTALEMLKHDYSSLVQAVQSDLSEKDKKESFAQQSNGN